LSWLIEWIVGDVLQALGEAIHRRHGWGGCASVILVLVALGFGLFWLAGVFFSDP